MSAKIKSKWWTKPAGHLVWFVMYLVCRTLRFRVHSVTDPECKEGPSAWKNGCYIATIWHNRIFTPCYVYRKILKGTVPMCMLTSASKDGTLLSTVAADFGMATVRGSSRRRGAVGFMDMVREVKAGSCMCITPDGPKGPIYRCHPGAVKLASVTGVPILPINISYHSCWRIRKAWDKFIIPKPFSRVDLVWGEPLYVPGDLTHEQVTEYCEKVNELLAHSKPDFD